MVLPKGRIYCLAAFGANRTYLSKCEFHEGNNFRHHVPLCIIVSPPVPVFSTFPGLPLPVFSARFSFRSSCVFLSLDLSWPFFQVFIPLFFRSTGLNAAYQLPPSSLPIYHPFSPCPPPAPSHPRPPSAIPSLPPTQLFLQFCF